MDAADKIQQAFAMQVNAIRQAGGYVHPALYLDVDLARVGNECIVAGDIAPDELSVIAPNATGERYEDAGTFKVINNQLNGDWLNYYRTHCVVDSCVPVISLMNHDDGALPVDDSGDTIKAHGVTICYTTNREKLGRIWGL